MRLNDMSLLLLFLLTMSFCAFAQVPIEGYVFETGNRGYLSTTRILVEEESSHKIIAEVYSDESGYFSFLAPSETKIKVYATKDMFNPWEFELLVQDDKKFLSVEMERSPGYQFEITMAGRQVDKNQPVDAITGARIEVYNNTTKESIMDLRNHPSPQFNVNLKQGNHYTILIRKEGYLSKRMEAFVDVEDCILCFEGLGKIRPEVSDNLTEGNEYGVLLANVELEPLFKGKKMKIRNLYYDFNKWNLKIAAKEELNKVITLMGDNPEITVELGSHTDSRGDEESNQTLSEKRAKAAVEYLINKGGLPKSRISFAGYGESQLVNNCKDGIPCSDDEHAKNRRTELKITEIGPASDRISLAEMKRKEEMDEMVESLMDQEQIKAKDEAELQEILRSRKETLSDTLPKEPKVDIEEQRRLLEERKKKFVPTFQPSDRIGPPNNYDVESQEAPNTPIADRDKTKMNGFKIVLLESDRPLPATHPILKKFRKLEVWNKDGSILYMLPMSSGEEGRSRLKTIKAEDIPDAYLVFFIDDEMMSEKF